jgi:phage/plasmid-like protein (TIGR03299 family)
MAHLLDSMFSVREVPWHGLGTILDEYPADWDEARTLAGLNWEPISAPVYDHVSAVTAEGELVESYEKIDGFYTIKRSDTGHILHIPRDSYEIFPNRDLGPLIEAILNQAGGQYQYETAGSLDEGRKVWVMIRAAEPMQIKGDPRGAVMPYVALQNSHDGSGALRAQRLRTRIVCANTSHAADLESEKSGLQFVFRHTKSIHERVEFAKAVLAGMSADQVAAQEHAADLLALPVSERGRRAFVEMFIPTPVAEVITPRVQGNIDRARGQVWANLNSVTCEGIENTAYGLVQAAVEYLDHGRKSRTAETKFQRCILSTEPMKRVAEKMAREAALIS